MAVERVSVSCVAIFIDTTRPDPLRRWRSPPRIAGFGLSMGYSPGLAVCAKLHRSDVLSMAVRLACREIAAQHSGGPVTHGAPAGLSAITLIGMSDLCQEGVFLPAVERTVARP